MKIFNLSEPAALAVSRLIDYHDQPTTSRRRRLVIQAALRDIFDAPTTATLRQARDVRKGCVLLGIYERPKRQHEQPRFLLKANRPVVRRAPRHHT